jgi:hypothetical protein
MFLPLGIDNAWDLEAFKEGFEIKINRVLKDYMEFDMIGEQRNKLDEPMAIIPPVIL